MKKEKRKRSYFTLSPRLKPKKVLSPQSIIFSLAVLLTFQLSISRVAVLSDGRDGKLFSRREFSQTHHEDSSTENETSLKIFRKTIDNILSLVNTSADRRIFHCFVPLISQHLAGTW